MSSEPLSSPSPPNRSELTERVEYSSSPPASSQGTSLLTTPSPRPRGTAVDFIQVDWTRLGRQELAKWPGFERYTGGQDTRAWWQQYGYRVEDRSTSRQGNRLKWICADCFARGFKKKSDFCFVCSTGAAIKKHLRNAHGILAPNDVAGGVRASSLDGRLITHFIGADFNNPHDQFLVSKLRGRFNSKGLLVLLLDWITYHNLPFDIVNTERFQRLLLYGNPLLDATHIPPGRRYFACSNLNTEVQSGPSYTAFLGINAQFIDHDFAQHRILLGLRPLSGKHNGASLADEVADTLAFWQLNNPDTVGYFTLDNAASNDTCMEDLAFEHGFSPEERRIRCAAHILNLCVRAMLYGSKRENFAAIVAADGDDLDDDEEQVDQAIDEALNGEMEDGTDEDPGSTAVDITDEDLISSHPAPEEINAASFREYSQNGAPGMLHNIGLQLRNTQLYEQFLQSQRKESGHGTTLHWAFNNATRWNSDMRMMERALRLRPALNTFFNDVQNRWETEGLCERTKPAVLQYRLSAYDWKVIEVLIKLLKPFEIATKQLQGSGVPGGRSTCGSSDEYFPVFEILLDHLESAIEGTIFEEVEDPVTREKKDVEVAIYDGLDSRTRRLLKVYIKLGWKKLHKYYSRLTSAAYVGAVVFNPAKKWRLLDQLWSRVPSRKTKSWRSEYEAKLLEIWEKYRERDVDNEVLATSEEASMGYIERRLARTVAGSPFSQGSCGASGARKSNRKTKPSAAGATGDDEYARYCAEDVVNSHHYRSRPIDWWKINRSRYPRLSLMAVDMLTIPSTSAESERTFSSAGRMTAPLRSRLRREIVAMAQCIRSWSKAGIYTPSLPLFSLNEDQWVDALASLKGPNDV
ncbi:ribonuclease H-like protein [Purpureocillium lilacinum]|uniref:Ribonuclease H-like protein n=1 Tax=Purpureocillium lilacinum TaxID=33203 RepID=A0A179EYM2_PURLI|nr:ribonuclease H-like protein [Purpureocillium lilacinum]OAQ58284.1 ribonuclease H-like protein [Purpureocillium lilacinum]